MLSVAILAYNEEPRIRSTVLTVIEEAGKFPDLTLDIMLVNDGSSDDTGKIVTALEKEFPFVRAIHNPTNYGFGRSFKRAIEAAKYDRITLLPGDNAVSRYSIKNIFRHLNDAEVIVAYTVNTDTRTRLRYCLSTFFSLAYNLTFDLNIRYMQGTPVFPVARLRQLELRSDFSILSEINVKLLRQGVTFMEIEGYLAPKDQTSSVMRVRTLIREANSFFHLVWDVFVKHRTKYSLRPRRIIPTA